jgi:hypothetical protein
VIDHEDSLSPSADIVYRIEAIDFDGSGDVDAAGLLVNRAEVSSETGCEQVRPSRDAQCPRSLRQRHTADRSGNAV